jgi:hypothetical protein
VGADVLRDAAARAARRERPSLATVELGLRIIKQRVGIRPVRVVSKRRRAARSWVLAALTVNSTHQI